MAQQPFLSDPQNEYDAVVCGAGSTIASWLAQDPDLRGLIIKAGDDDDDPGVSYPDRGTLNLRKKRDWGWIIEPNPALPGTVDAEFDRAGDPLNASVKQQRELRNWRSEDASLHRLDVRILRSNHEPGQQ
jgi:choline dehydrogenase-like flavoprotein